MGCARVREAPCRVETRPSVDLRLLEAVALGEPLSVRQVDARGELGCFSTCGMWDVGCGM